MEPRTIDEYFVQPPPEKDAREACGLCQKTWESTSQYPTVTNLCGHTYHTICLKLREFDHINYQECPNEICNYPNRHIVELISIHRDQARIDEDDEIVARNLAVPEFKRDLKGLRGLIRNVSSMYTQVQKAYKNVTNTVIHKHIYTINQIQSELNAAVCGVSKSDQMKEYRKSLGAYRKKAASIYRLYRISFRNLRQRKIINVGWRLRSILERHHIGFYTHRYTIRICPGKKIWRDPLEEV